VHSSMRYFLLYPDIQYSDAVPVTEKNAVNTVYTIVLQTGGRICCRQANTVTITFN